MSLLAVRGQSHKLQMLTRWSKRILLSEMRLKGCKVWSMLLNVRFVMVRTRRTQWCRWINLSCRQTSQSKEARMWWIRICSRAMTQCLSHNGWPPPTPSRTLVRMRTATVRMLMISNSSKDLTFDQGSPWSRLVLCAWSLRLYLS